MYVVAGGFYGVPSAVSIEALQVNNVTTSDSLLLYSDLCSRATERQSIIFRNIASVTPEKTMWISEGA